MLIENMKPNDSAISRRLIKNVFDYAYLKSNKNVYEKIFYLVKRQEKVFL